MNATLLQEVVLESLWLILMCIVQGRKTKQMIVDGKEDITLAVRRDSLFFYGYISSLMANAQLVSVPG